MIFNKADFIASYGISSQLPESDRPELSFSGRSNVGKSSLINKLCSRKNLARVSSTPGKTATASRNCRQCSTPQWLRKTRKRSNAMAYNEFAYFYDEFNGEADYDALYSQIHAKLEAHGIHDGIVADLGCGTGELTLMLTQAGYDMIGIDQSEEMLCVVRDKAEQLGLSGRLLLLRQDLLKLDLYGTIRAAVSTFDTFNHIPDLDTAIANAGFFMEKGGVFLFDMNTPYKHQKVLGDNAFTFEEEDAACVWRNHYNAADRKVEITVDIDYHETGEHFHEEFCEYTYDLDTIRAALEKHGFALESVCDGETFGPLTEESQRYFFCATKQYTQLEE